MATKNDAKNDAKQHTKKPTHVAPVTLTVTKHTALAELVEEGETFERRKITAKVWRGLCLLNVPTAKVPQRSYHVWCAQRWIAKLPSA